MEGRKTGYCNLKHCGKREFESKPGAGGNCGGCGRVYYCSKEHQRKDFVFHKHICSRDPAQRIRNFLKLMTTPNGLFTILESHIPHPLLEVGFSYHISLPITVQSRDNHCFRVDLLRLPHGGTSCATCYQPLAYNNVLLFIQHRKRLLYEGQNVDYFQCKSCSGKRVLCPSSFTARDKCPQEKKLHYELFFYSQHIDVFDNVKDINHYIGSLLYLLFDDNCSCKEIL